MITLSKTSLIVIKGSTCGSATSFTIVGLPLSNRLVFGAFDTIIPSICVGRMNRTISIVTKVGPCIPSFGLQEYLHDNFGLR